ncbi:MAG: flagellar basal body-associated FliL family protein [Deltaproteobacteria bacterium]|jgi:flagellar FliL protein|nr:flagellar basal body-associated FliL family protein [Deltaproteobacteria bacterium]NOR11262.1 flagellar basal body protein FliL [Desulfovibrionaceae bacterium]
MADEATEKAENEEKPKKKSKLLLFIILGVVILLAAGGGFFAYTTFFAAKPEVAQQEAEISTDLPAPVGEIITLKPFVVNLADPKGKRYLKLKLSLELDSLEASERVLKIAPKLRDIVIMMLTSLAFEEVMTPEGKIRIRDELTERFNRAARPDKIKNIYFSEFVVQ